MARPPHNISKDKGLAKAFSSQKAQSKAEEEQILQKTTRKASAPQKQPSAPIKKQEKAIFTMPPSGVLPDAETLMAFIRASDQPLTKRDITRAFQIKGPDKILLKKTLRELMEDGQLSKEHDRSLRPSDQLPSVAVIVFDGLTKDGESLARPLDWTSDAPAPIILLAETGERKKAGFKGPAMGAGDKALARLELVKAAKDPSTPAVYRAKIIKMLNKNPEHILGVFKGGDKGGRIHPTSKKIRDEYLVSADDAKDIKDGDLVLAEPLGGKNRRGGPLMARITEKLGSLLDARSISMIAIHDHDIPYIFPEAVLKEAAKAKPAPFEGRTDLRAIPLITIDPADARDHDDAIFAESDPDPKNPGGWHVIVAIADVSYYVPEGSAIDREAIKRGNSCYFPDRVVPMLPEILSADLCSLKPHQDRPVLAAHMWFTSDGRKIRHHFVRAIMRSHANLSYLRAQRALDGIADEETAPLVEPVLKPLQGAFKAMMQAQNARGPLALDVAERKIELTDDGHVATVSLRERLETHRIVEEFMINANVAAAEALAQAKIPLLYRVHEEPPMDKLEALRGFLDSLGLSLAKGTVMRPALFNGILAKVRGRGEEHLVNEVVLRSQTQAYYSPDNLGHFGLALQNYAHFTSPIRRYSDLIVHRGLIRAFGLGPDGLSEQQAQILHQIGEDISKTERRAMLAERDSNDRYLAAYLSDRIDQLFPGRIAGVSRFGLFVALEPSGGEGLIPISHLGDDFYELDDTGHRLIGKRSGESFCLGDALEVRLLEANRFTGGLRLEIAGERRRARAHKSRRHPKVHTGRAPAAKPSPAGYKKERHSPKKSEKHRSKGK